MYNSQNLDHIHAPWHLRLFFQFADYIFYLFNTIRSPLLHPSLSSCGIFPANRRNQLHGYHNLLLHVFKSLLHVAAWWAAVLVLQAGEEGLAVPSVTVAPRATMLLGPRHPGDTKPQLQLTRELEQNRIGEFVRSWVGTVPRSDATIGGGRLTAAIHLADVVLPLRDGAGSAGCANRPELEQNRIDMGRREKRRSPTAGVRFGEALHPGPAVSEPVYAKGERVEYLGPGGAWVSATVVAVGYDEELVPYYEITVDGSNAETGKSTVGPRLRRRAATTQLDGPCATSATVDDTKASRRAAPAGMREVTEGDSDVPSLVDPAGREYFVTEDGTFWRQVGDRGRVAPVAFSMHKYVELVQECRDLAADETGPRGPMLWLDGKEVQPPVPPRN